MHHTKFFPLPFLMLALLAILPAVSIGAAASAPVKVLHMFSGADGQNPAGNLVADKAGNLYGTTEYGGAGGYYGTVFQLSPPTVSGGVWINTTIYAFTNTGDGARPTGGLVFDSSGNLYGTTSDADAGGYGEVFELRRPATKGGGWTETVLYSFQGTASDGAYPHGSLIFDPKGNLFGATQTSVFELSPPASKGGQWAFAQLHAFACCTGDGFSSEAALARDSQGNLYGTTELGGFYGTGYCAYLGCGTVFEVSPPATAGGVWTEQVLYQFKSNIEGFTDGLNPFGGLVLDRAGNVYGNTYGGGGLGGGTVFELSPPAVPGDTWTETVLHNFSYSKTDGAVPLGNLLQDSTGNLYGTTELGGNPCILNGTAYGCGTIFKLTPTQGGLWSETVLYLFTKGPNVPRQPGAGLYLDHAGNLYGTTIYGGDTKCSSDLASGCGTVFRLQP